MTSKVYSHGLESVYAFETIDPTTVRTIQKRPCYVEKEPRVSSQIEQSSSSSQIQKTTSSIFQDTAPHKRTRSCYPERKTLFLYFSSHNQLLNLRFLEPVEALHLSPFLLSKLRHFSLKTIEDTYSYCHDLLLQIEKTQDLSCEKKEKATFLKKDKLSLLQRDELLATVIQYTFQGARTVSFVEWDRLAALLFISSSLSEQAQYKKLFSLPFCIQYGKKLSKLPHKELSSLEKKTLQTALIHFLEDLFIIRILPWLNSKENIIHQTELMNFLLDLFPNTSNSLDYTHLLSYLQFIAWKRGESFLYSNKLLLLEHVSTTRRHSTRLYCLGNCAKIMARIALQAIDDFYTIFKKNNMPVEDCVSFIRSIERYLIQRWQMTSYTVLQRLIIWTKYE